MAVRVNAECHHVFCLLIVKTLFRCVIIYFSVFACVLGCLVPSVHAEVRREHVYHSLHYLLRQGVCLSSARQEVWKSQWSPSLHFPQHLWEHLTCYENTVTRSLDLMNVKSKNFYPLGHLSNPHVCVCLCTCVEWRGGACLSQCAYGDLRKTSWNQSSLGTLWVTSRELNLSDLSHLTHPQIKFLLAIEEDFSKQL